MSSFYDDASLVVIPSGYKTSKVYSEKPTDGSGDLTFTRTGDTATRVNSAGLIEKVRTNLALRSQSFATSAVWSTSQGTITNNAGTAPDGTSTASKIVATNADPYVYQPLTLTGSVAVSCYVKGVGSSIGKLARIIVGASTTDVTMDGTWQRISVTHTAAGAELYGLEIPNPGATSDEVLMWGFQVETGDIATSYIPTTTAAVSVGPVANVPRLDYLGSTCPRLLLEPQRTNALLQSETLNSATWTKDGGSVTANAVASPDGYTNADLFTEDTSTGNHRVYQNSISTSANQPVTFSVFAKYNGRQYVYLRMDVVSPKTAVFDIQNGTAGTVSSGASSKIENYGNGWYRLILTVDALAGNAAVCEGLLGFLSGPSFSNASYTGNGTAGAYLWGFQGEANASYATSYIPTLAASTTRGADACSKTGISSLIGQTEGASFLDFQFNGATESIIMDISASGLSPQNRIILYQPSGGILQFIILDNSVSQVSIASSSYSIGQRLKVAIAYKANDFAFYINGVQIGTDNSGSVPATSRIDIGNRQDAAYPATISVNQALLFKTRLTNAELAELTTL